MIIRTGRRLLALLLLLILALAGCTTRKPPDSRPVAPPLVIDPGPNPEAVPTVLEGCLEPPAESSQPHANMHVSGRLLIVFAGTCSVQIGEAADLISIFPPAHLDREAILAGLKVSPPEALKSARVVPDSGRPPHLQVTFHPGKPGDWLAIGWEGEGYRFGFELEHLPNPRVDGFYQVGENHFQRITDFLMLPPGQPVTLRFHGEGGITPDQVAERVRHSLGTTPASVTFTSGDAVQVSMPDPPEMLFFNFLGLRGTYADVELNGYTIFTVQPPQAVWHDPATGQERTIGPVPPDIFRGYLSPDGAHALLLGYAPESPYATRIYVMETATGQIHHTAFRDGLLDDQVFWRADQVVYATNRRMQIWHLGEDREEIIPSQANFWGPISPDGRYVAGFAVDLDQEEPATWLAPATIYLFDLQTRNERTFPDVVKVRVPHSSRPYHLPMSWDGSRLVLGETLPERQAGQPDRFAPVTLDPSTGTVTPGEGQVPEPAPGGWLTGPGGWEAIPHGWWDEMKIRQAGGTERSLGPGYVLGWEPNGWLLVLRWEIRGPKRYREYE